MGRISGFLAVPIGDKLRLLLAIALLASVRVGIVVVPLSSFRRLLLRPAATMARLVPGSPSPARVAWTVRTADRQLPGHRTCLMRSLSAETIHRLYDHDVVHRIGVDTSASGTEDGVAHATENGFAAHSWIEYDGEVLVGALEDLSRYDPLPPLNGEGP